MLSMFMLHHIYTHPFYGGWVHWVIVVLRLSDEPMCNNVSFIKCWTLMIRWEEVENKLGCFIHEVMVTPFSRGYVNGCNNGFVSHKNPKRNPPGFQHGHCWFTEAMFKRATIDTVYWSCQLKEDMGALSLWSVCPWYPGKICCYVSNCFLENQCGIRPKQVSTRQVPK